MITGAVVSLVTSKGTATTVSLPEASVRSAYAMNLPPSDMSGNSFHVTVTSVTSLTLVTHAAGSGASWPANVFCSTPSPVGATVSFITNLQGKFFPYIPILKLTVWGRLVFTSSKFRLHDTNLSIAGVSLKYILSSGFVVPASMVFSGIRSSHSLFRNE